MLGTSLARRGTRLGTPLAKRGHWPGTPLANRGLSLLRSTADSAAKMVNKFIQVTLRYKQAGQGATVMGREIPC